jgi:hypothetical protein
MPSFQSLTLLPSRSCCSTVRPSCRQATTQEKMFWCLTRAAAPQTTGTSTLGATYRGLTRPYTCVRSSLSDRTRARSTAHVHERSVATLRDARCWAVLLRYSTLIRAYAGGRYARTSSRSGGSRGAFSCLPSCRATRTFGENAACVRRDLPSNGTVLKTRSDRCWDEDIGVAEFDPSRRVSSRKPSWRHAHVMQHN